MESVKIFKLLFEETTTQRNRFLKFLNSPYHNVNKYLISLAEIFNDHIKNPKDDGLSREFVFSRLFENEPYEDKKLRKLTSDLMSRYESFLIHEQLNSDQLLQHELLLKRIQENKYLEMQEKAKQNAKTYFERHPEKSGEYFSSSYTLERILYNLESEYEKRKIKKGDKRNINIDILNANLDQFYVIEKLRLACGLIAWQRIFKIQERPFEIEVILKMLERNNLLENPVVDTYRHAYLMLIDRDADNHYEALKALIIKNIDLFPKTELKEIYDSMLTFCIGKFNTDTKYLNESLTLYDFAIDKSIILENGIISPITFRNYVVIGLRIKEFEKVETFIRQKAELLKPSDRENTTNFCLARLYWYKKDWDKVIQQLAIVEFEDSYYYYVNSKIMLVSAYYELGEFDTIDYTLDSFYSYLNRKKDLNEERKIAYKLYISYSKKLVKIFDGDKEGAQKLKEAILNEKTQMNGKDWLIEKVDELLK